MPPWSPICTLWGREPASDTRWSANPAARATLPPSPHVPRYPRRRPNEERMTTPDLPFASPYRHDLVRVAAAVPLVRLGDPRVDAEHTVDLARQAHDDDAAVVVFPELGLVGYSNQDLFHQDALAARRPRRARRRARRVGRPAPGAGGRTAAAGRAPALQRRRGRCTGGTCSVSCRSRTCRTTGSSTRSATSARPVRRSPITSSCSADATCRSAPTCCSTSSTCPTSWSRSRSARTSGSPIPPSTYATMAGATVIANLSGSNITIGKAGYRRQLCSAQSARTIGAYVYVGRGRGRVDHRPRVGRPRDRRRERQRARGVGALRA